MREITQRIDGCLNDIVEKEMLKNSEKVVIVSHGTVLSALSAQYSDYGCREVHHMISMPDVAVFDWKYKRFTRFW